MWFNILPKLVETDLRKVIYTPSSKPTFSILCVIIILKHALYRVFFRIKYKYGTIRGYVTLIWKNFVYALFQKLDADN